ncbi:phosphoglycerate mutase [Aureimonas sp. SA4125]|uniref:histidine phosphatase family protein n=1 Tax=Aureimonas sp. SA4125 TaxID=2826993 RepID=UPI001CC8167A|nr:histidine phosphatase family protein [Aureimonas sp. SA4125]BDA83084.1 phosphoglycerate mutase [Aureimonas sp. SA4125]
MTLPLIYLCRHGQTDWNAEERLQGQAEISLNATGRTQAKRNGRKLADLLGRDAGALHYLASPMLRTRETMEIIRGELGLDSTAYATDARLKELHFGDWEGSTLDEISARTPEAVAEREAAKWDYVPPGPTAESYAMLAERARPVFEALTVPTVVVAHGGIVRAFLWLYGGTSPRDAAFLTIPQDQVLRAEDGTVDWI